MAPPSRRISRRRAVVSLDRSTTGDVGMGDVAGGNIYSGLSPEHVAAVLDREITFRNEVLKAYERDSREMRARLDHMAQDTALYRELERDERTARQAETDASRRKTLHWLIALTVAIAVGFCLLAWLLYDRYTAAAVIRIWLGGSAALAAALARH